MAGKEVDEESYNSMVVSEGKGSEWEQMGKRHRRRSAKRKKKVEVSVGETESEEREEEARSPKTGTLNVVISLNSDEIASTSCECPRGSVKCSHSAALAIFAHHNLGPTDQECKWKKPAGPKEVKSAQDLFPTSRSYDPLSRPVTDGDRQCLREELQKQSLFSGIGWLLSPEPPQQACDPVLGAAVKAVICNLKHLGHEGILLGLQVPTNLQKAVERATVGQRDNPLRHSLQRGRVTASNFGMILKVKKESGLWLSPSGILGASPDGLVGDNALVEVKCPYRERDMTISAAAQSPGFCLKEEGGSYILPEDHIYWHQVQGQLHIAGKDLCYFTVWTTKDAVIIAIPRCASWLEPESLGGLL
ncbi:hypothetical protein SKAU_G00244470 [Synaphobranchus kaupii]|uniref:SWIM-type domain-containing protein n=1 Tax=Synaphobranchus kaupii TaxID=118154 RepID=A0A9Q1F1M0_SYNKA|nr:hypothetical protein SKAU_G00244470 [Synaphobranchus kaupii]